MDLGTLFCQLPKNCLAFPGRLKGKKDTLPSMCNMAIKEKMTYGFFLGLPFF